jgi:cell wall-associated protease
LHKALAIILFSSISFSAASQPPNWQNLSLKNDSVFGISTERAYTELLSHKKKFKPVIVGVIDSGVDTAHEDLRAIIWTNPKELPGNGIDDDHDGYADDMHGWDFIGGPNGDVYAESLELTRMVRSGKATQEMLSEYDKIVDRDRNIIRNIKGFEMVLDSMLQRMQKDTPVLADFDSYEPQSRWQGQVKRTMIGALQGNGDFTAFKKDQMDGAIRHFQDDLDTNMSISFNPRMIVGDDTANAEEHFYGNADVFGGPRSSSHGTHVSGIIGASRGNGIGIQGIADHVWIMSIRTVPGGDERDKDVANAIRFAADHGARVVNMSFGKGYSPDKKVVDEAVRYAMSKDVLLVHAAGNDGKNLDKENNFPNPIYADSSGEAAAWIEVGATGWKDDSMLVAPFSNYGRTKVDVFAPGVEINSTVPYDKYEKESGTSMACPVVAGLAALIREYYPKLSAVQVKEVIMKSVVKPEHFVIVKDGSEKKKVLMSDISVSGGVVNAYNALKLAAKY